MAGEHRLTKESTRLVRGLLGRLEEREARQDTTRALLRGRTDRSTLKGAVARIPATPNEQGRVSGAGEAGGASRP